MSGRKKITTICCLFLIGLLWLYGCGSPSSDSKADAMAGSESSEQTEQADGLVYERSADLLYAKNFSIDYYKGGYKLLKITDGTKILLVPEDKEVPENIRRRYDHIKTAGQGSVSGIIICHGHFQ